MHYLILLKCTWVKLPSRLSSRSSNVNLKNISCTVIIMHYYHDVDDNVS